MLDFAESILLPVLALVLLFGTVYGLVATWLRTRNQQRLALIEKGHGAGLVAREQHSAPLLRWATFLGGAGLGLLAGDLLARNTTVDGVVAYFSMLLLGVGAGLIGGNLIVERRSHRTSGDG